MRKPVIKKHLIAWVDSKRIIKPTCIVLHWWGEPINNQGISFLYRLLKKRQLSVQFAVLANGDIFQLSPRPDTFCKHAKCANSSSIGIEIEGFGSDDLDNNEIQFNAVLDLTWWITEEYKIEKDFQVENIGSKIRFYGIASHKQIDIYCPDSNGKDDVHDEYIKRIKNIIATSK